MMYSFLKKLSLTFAVTASAFLCGTTIGYVYPAGARAGETVQVIVGGQALWGSKTVCIEGGGVRLLKWQNAPGTFYAGCGEQGQWAKDYMRTIYSGGSRQPIRKNPKSFGVWRYNKFMEELDQLDPLMLSLACKGIFERPNSLQASPAIGQKVILTLKIDKDAKPGMRELRLTGTNGSLRTTNPLTFFINNVPEFQEQYYQMPPLKRNPVTFTIPSAVNGRASPNVGSLLSIFGRSPWRTKSSALFPARSSETTSSRVISPSGMRQQSASTSAFRPVSSARNFRLNARCPRLAARLRAVAKWSSLRSHPTWTSTKSASVFIF